jgi:hypothetical protein
MMAGVPPETCLAIKKHWNNKFRYTVASCWFFYGIYITMHESMNIKLRKTQHFLLSVTGSHAE